MPPAGIVIGSVVGGLLLIAILAFVLAHNRSSVRGSYGKRPSKSRLTFAAARRHTPPIASREHENPIFDDTSV